MKSFAKRGYLLNHVQTTIAEMTDPSNVSLKTAMAAFQVKETAIFISTESMAYVNQTHPSKDQVFLRQYADCHQTVRNHLNPNLKVTICTITVLFIANYWRVLHLPYLNLPYR